MLSPYSCHCHRLAPLLLIAIILSQNLQIAITESCQQSETNSQSVTTFAMGVANSLTKKKATANTADRETNTAQSSLSSCDPFTLDVLQDLRQKYKHQPTFLQAVEELALSVADLLVQDPFYRRAFAIMTEPERTISFRVPWEDDQGHMHYNRGWRVEFSSVLGPYKGGLRFHPSVDEGVLKFLGFEQVFKNALTGLPMGGGKGGSDFDPKGKSEAEVRRFCQSFMTELFRYLHPSTDVPAGDIGVGGREIGYLYGEYKRLTNRHGEGVLTGKSLNFGGSPVRPEATGWGLVYMTQLAVQRKFKERMRGLRCAVSGSGNVAQHAAEKLIELGALVVTVSDSNGVLVFEKGMTKEDWALIMECKNVRRGRLLSLKENISGYYVDGESPWSLQDVKYDLALPCATQNEIGEEAAQRMVANGVKGIFEGANLPTTIEAQHVFRENDLLYIPGKAANAGGVGVSGLEMSQNAQRLTWTREQVDQKLQDMMDNIYNMMVKQQEVTAEAGKECTLEQGANRAGFLKVAEAMRELGWIF